MDRERQRVAGLPTPEQVAYNIDWLKTETNSAKEIGWKEAGQRLAELGDESILQLIEELHHPNIGWQAVMILGRIGRNSDVLIDALRKCALSQNEASSWSARSLGILGDMDFLIELTYSDDTRMDAVWGIAEIYRASANDGTKAVALDYTPLERLLDKKCRECERLIAEELKPGHGFINISQSDIPEAIRGLTASHPIIRQHAKCLLT